MAVHCLLWTGQQLTIHAVNSIQTSMETGPEITDVPKPPEKGRNVNVTRTKTEHGEKCGQYWTEENRQL